MLAQGDTRMNLERLIDKSYVKGVDSLGEAGFSVEVVRVDGGADEMDEET